MKFIAQFRLTLFFGNKPKKIYQKLLSTKVENEKKTFYAIDILADHGGKIALAGFLFSAALIYRYVKSGSNRNALEKIMANGAALEPIEVNEIRFANHISAAQYKNLVRSSREFFRHGCTYVEFIKFSKEHLKSDISAGYLIDRVIYFYINEIKLRSNSESMDKDPNHSNLITLDEILSVDYLLTVMSMSVQATPEERVALLFEMGLREDNLDYPIAANFVPNVPKGISLDDAGLVVRHLVESCQVPPEKRVVETGVNWPVKTYREKTAHEMV